MSFNTIIDWNGCSADQQQQLLTRPAISASDSISKTVTEILNNVKANGDAALREYSAKFDKTTVAALQVSRRRSPPPANASARAEAGDGGGGEKHRDLPQRATAAGGGCRNAAGVRCQQVTRPIASVGLYIPGGSAPLFSTVLMLATPARIAGCQQVVLCSPPPIADEILYAAQLCGVKTIFNVGGARPSPPSPSVPSRCRRWIKSLARATLTSRKPNARSASVWTAQLSTCQPARRKCWSSPTAAPTPDFVASDLLSQAEHGGLAGDPPDPGRRHGQPRRRSRGTPAGRPAARGNRPRGALRQPDHRGPRSGAVRGYLQPVRPGAPDHSDPSGRELVDSITSAGSVFLGDWSPESAGDYASGTNHVLPTYGYTATCSSLGLADFQKRMTVQELSRDGFAALASTIEITGRRRAP